MWIRTFVSENNNKYYVFNICDMFQDIKLKFGTFDVFQHALQ